MDKNNIIGITLIFMLFFAWSYLNTDTPEVAAEKKRVKDSIELAQQQIVNPTVPAETKETVPAPPTPEMDTLRKAEQVANFGSFASGMEGTETTQTLENDFIKLTFSNKGGKIVEAEIKQYNKRYDDEEGVEHETTVKLLNDEKNTFNYTLPLANGRELKTEDLFFDGQLNGNTVTFRANAGTGYFEQKYTLSPDSYNIDYSVSTSGLDQVLNLSNGEIALKWDTYLDKIEKNTYYERIYSSVYYKVTDDDADYCSCSSDDEEELKERIKWISQSNQFFNTSLVATNSFNSGVVATQMMTDEESEDLKLLKTDLMMPLGGSNPNTFDMKWYIGPNEFDRLIAYDAQLEDVIPYGWSFFGTINRWVIRPLFNFLSGFIGSKGIVILVLTFLVKLALYPLTYKMLHSQSKMAALKPRIAGMKEKFGDDAQKQQMETMKMYREYGVNPLGGCFPIFLQMPIWFALYRFFPASIDFRQAGFWWADDLSSYDAFFKLGFDLPFGMGAHISLFTMLWAFTTLIYTYYNSKHMDMSANPAMKYMQYLMPIMFLGFFNSYASGLTCYLFFSNIFNIGQTVITKNYIINQKKLEKELVDYSKKPKKKKGGFGERLEKALKDQQKIQSDRDAKKKKK